MAVHCANCGEELLGAVNRCWNCGREFVSHKESAKAPPLRREPVVDPLNQALPAILVEGDLNEPPTPVRESPADRWQRRGSPFVQAADDAAASESSELISGHARKVRYPQGAAAGAGATASIVLACISLAILVIFPVGSLLISAVGLGLGIWGLQAQRRGPAIVALLLCCLAFALCAGRMAYQAYLQLYSM